MRRVNLLSCTGHLQRRSRSAVPSLNSLGKRTRLLSVSSSPSSVIQSLPEVLESESLIRGGKAALALSPLSRAIEICEHSMGSDSEFTWAARTRLIELCFYLGNYERVDRMLEECGKEGKQEIVNYLARSYLLQGRAEEAIKALQKASDDLSSSSPDTFALSRSLLGLALHAQDRREEGERAFEESVSFRALEGASSLTKAKVWNNYAVRDYVLWGERQDEKERGKAIKVIEQEEKDDAVSKLQTGLSTLSESDFHYRAHLLSSLGEIELLAGEHEKASEWLADAMKAEEKDVNHLSLLLGRILFGLARCYHSVDQAVMAEGLYTTSIEKYQAAPYLSRADRRDFSALLSSYAQLLGQWEKRQTEQKRWKDKALEQEKKIAEKGPWAISSLVLLG